MAGNGVRIDELMGTHAGANPISGDFSLSCKGMKIENGKLTGPVEQITVSGNFYKLLVCWRSCWRASALWATISGSASPAFARWVLRPCW